MFEMLGFVPAVVILDDLGLFLDIKEFLSSCLILNIETFILGCLCAEMTCIYEVRVFGSFQV